MLQPAHAAAARREDQHVLDGVALEHAVLPLDLLAVLGRPPALPERDPSAARALDDLEAAALVDVVFLASVIGLDRLEHRVLRFARAALARRRQRLPLRLVFRHLLRRGRWHGASMRLPHGRWDTAKAFSAVA